MMALSNRFLTRRGFLKGAATGVACYSLSRFPAFGKDRGAYSVAVLGDTHFDAEPETVYHSDWDSSESNASTHHAEFIRNGEMWRERCPSLVAASAALAAATPTRFLLQLGDLVQGDCGNSTTHVQMLGDAVTTLRSGFPTGFPFLTVLGNHDVRGTGARAAYLNFARSFLTGEIASLTGVTPSAIDYPVFSFRLDDDLWVFCDFETVNMNPICDAIDADPVARHVFLVTHGPFTTCANTSNFRWRLAGRSGSEASRPRLYETLSRRHAIILSGHTHKTNYYWHENAFGGFAEITVNSVWSSEALATSTPIHDAPEDYAVMSSADYKREIAYFRPGLKKYFYNKGAGHYRLDVSDEGVTIEFYPGAATSPARIFLLKRGTSGETVNGSGWVEETALATGTTGTWTSSVNYDEETRKLPIAGDRTFTPLAPSGGSPVTMTIQAQFTEMSEAVDAPEGVQAAVQLGANGFFQVWTSRNGTARWLDVAAESVTPRAGVDYTFRFLIDYETRCYSVAVQNASGTFIPCRSNGESTFALATNATHISAVRFMGGGFLTSLLGDFSKSKGLVLTIR